MLDALCRRLEFSGHLNQNLKVGKLMLEPFEDDRKKIVALRVRAPLAPWLQWLK